MKIVGFVLLIVVAVIALSAFMVITVYVTEMASKLSELDSRMNKAERRVDDITEAGKILNHDLRVTQEQVDEAKRRAKL